MGDVVGRLFREFAITLAVTILISAVVALTLVPMLSARWLKPERETKTPRIANGRWSGSKIFLTVMRARSNGCWRGRRTLLVFAGSLALTALLFVAIPKGLFPEQDTGPAPGGGDDRQGVSFGRMSDLQGKVAHALLRIPMSKA
jgi:multidrug efflux pump